MGLVSQTKGQEETATSCARASFRQAVRINLFTGRCGTPWHTQAESPWPEVFTERGTGGLGLVEDWECWANGWTQFSDSRQAGLIEKN